MLKYRTVLHDYVQHFKHTNLKCLTKEAGLIYPE